VASAGALERVPAPQVPELKLVPEHRYEAMEKGLLRPIYAVADRQGRLHVANNTMKVYVFDSTGKYLRTYCRMGRGPGEVGMLMGIGLIRDTIVMRDVDQQRMVYYAADGSGKPRTVSYTASDQDGRKDYLPRAVLADGSLLRERRMSPGPSQGTVTQYARLDSGGRELNEITTIENPPPLTLTSGGKKTIYASHESEPVKVAVDQGGRFIYKVDATPATSENDAAISVTRYDIDGKIVWSKRFPYKPIRVNRDSIANSSREMGMTERNLVMSAYKKFHTPVERVIVGHDGTLFLQLFSAKSWRWRRISADGLKIGEFSVGTWFIYGGDADHLWLMDASEDDIAVVKMQLIPQDNH
jgi:hypothetical protein